MPPTSKLPPSLGDNARQELVLTRFEVPLPAGRKDIVSAFEGILNKGGVQKITVEVGRPIQVSRLVNKDSADIPIEAPPDDFWNQVRNGRLEEMKLKSFDSYELLFHACAWMTSRKLKPRILFCHDNKQLRQWLKVDDGLFPVDYVFGIETARQPDVPEDAVILAGTGFDETDVASTLGIRIPVETVAPASKVLSLKGRV